MLRAEEARRTAARYTGSLNLTELMEAIQRGILSSASRGGMRTTLRFLDSRLLDVFGVPVECRDSAFDRVQDELRRAGYGVCWCVESVRGVASDGAGDCAELCTRLDVTWGKSDSSSNP